MSEPAICPEFKVPCQRDCVILCSAILAVPQQDFQWTPHVVRPYVEAQKDAIAKLAAITGIPPANLEIDEGEMYEDTILAYLRFRGPLPEPPPGGWPKPNRRTRFRMWRHERNRKAQQYIHDHWLPEAFCDC